MFSPQHLVSKVECMVCLCIKMDSIYSIECMHLRMEKNEREKYKVTHKSIEIFYILQLFLFSFVMNLCDLATFPQINCTDNKINKYPMLREYNNQHQFSLHAIF